MRNIDFSDLIGVPWVAGGRSRSGADCWGIVIMVRYRAGLETPDAWNEMAQILSAAEHLPGPPEIPLGIAAWATQLEEPERYSVVRIKSAWPGCHYGVVIQRLDNTLAVIHSSKATGSVMQPLDSLWTSGKIEAVHRLVKPRE
jgi:hypothetical protein